MAIGAASLLLVLPFTPLDEYVRVLLRLGRGFDQDAYTIFGLVVQAGGPEHAGRIATLAAGAALLAATWRYRSFSLALAAALVLSPIVWLDYFAVASVALAVGRPRLSAIWFLPLATWGLQGAGIGTGDTAASVRVLIVFAVVFAVAFRAERAAAGRATAPIAPRWLAHEGRGRARRVGARLRRAPRRRRGLDVRRRPSGIARGRLPPRALPPGASSSSTARTRSRRRAPTSPAGATSIWPPLAAFFVVR